MSLKSACIFKSLEIVFSSSCFKNIFYLWEHLDLFISTTKVGNSFPELFIVNTIPTLFPFFHDLIPSSQFSLLRKTVQSPESPLENAEYDENRDYS